MSLGKYFTSSTFFGQIVAALAIIVGIALAFIFWLSFATKHGEVVVVPNLNKLNQEQVEEKLADLNLESVLLDTVDYNPDYPKMAVVEQEPAAGSEVKEGRKVYIKLNANGYAYIKMPDLIQQTYRQAVPTLKAIGLNEGTITYIPDIGKDMVLEMKLNGTPIKPGQKVMKSSKIDLVLGDGKIGYEDEIIDSLNVVLPANVIKNTNGQ